MSGDVLPGATVKEIGGTASAVTDSRGNFSMSVASELSYLKISAPNHVEKTVQVAIFEISDFENLDAVTGEVLPNNNIIVQKVNWVTIVAATAVCSAIVAALFMKRKTGTTVKAKI